MRAIVIAVVQYLPCRRIAGHSSGTICPRCALQCLVSIKYGWFANHQHSSCSFKTVSGGDDRCESLVSPDGGSMTSLTRTRMRAHISSFLTHVRRVLVGAMAAYSASYARSRAILCLAANSARKPPMRWLGISESLCSRVSPPLLFRSYGPTFQRLKRSGRACLPEAC